MEEAGDGEEALQRWREGHFDTVATDCHMPRMSGAELAAAIRLEERERGLAAVCIIGLTADAQPEEIERGLAAGMDECLIKPIGLDALQRALGVLARERQQGAEPLDEGALFDLAPLQPLTGGDEALVRNLLGELLATNRKDLVALAPLLEAGDAEGLAELAHRLIGAARVVKAAGVIAACRQLMAATADAPPDGARLRQAGDALARALTELESGLREHLQEA